jgi:O-antigen/teichoic acid export membrane protein
VIQRLKPKSEFSRNVLTLMTGTTIAQAIPIAISPILTRIYTPEDFGLLALYIAISSIIASVASGRYELAIMLPREDEDAINILALSFIIIVIVTITLTIMVMLYGEEISSLLENSEIIQWLYLIPVSVFFIGIFNTLSYYNNRKKYFKRLAKASIVRSLVMVIFQITVGYFKVGPSGLVGGEILSRIWSSVILLKGLIKDKLLITNVTLKEIFKALIKYKKFPKFSLPGVLVNTISQYIPTILIPIYFNTSILGYYFLTQRVLGSPSVLIGTSISQVFFEEASRERQETGMCGLSFDSTIKKLTIISMVAFPIIFFTVEEVFAFVFGEEWRIAGEYAMILVPLFAIRFIVSSVSAVDTIMEKQNIFLIFNIVLLSSTVLIFVMGSDYSFLYLLKALSWAIALIYAMYGLVLRRMAFNEI